MGQVYTTFDDILNDKDDSESNLTKLWKYFDLDNSKVLNDDEIEKLFNTTYDYMVTKEKEGLCIFFFPGLEKEDKEDLFTEDHKKEITKYWRSHIKELKKEGKDSSFRDAILGLLKKKKTDTILDEEWKTAFTNPNPDYEKIKTMITKLRYPPQKTLKFNQAKFEKLGKSTNTRGAEKSALEFIVSNNINTIYSEDKEPILSLITLLVENTTVDDWMQTLKVAATMEKEFLNKLIMPFLEKVTEDDYRYKKGVQRILYYAAINNKISNMDLIFNLYPNINLNPIEYDTALIVKLASTHSIEPTKKLLELARIQKKTAKKKLQEERETIELKKLQEERETIELKVDGPTGESTDSEVNSNSMDNKTKVNTEDKKNDRLKVNTDDKLKTSDEKVERKKSKSNDSPKDDKTKVNTDDKLKVSDEKVERKKSKSNDSPKDDKTKLNTDDKLKVGDEKAERKKSKSNDLPKDDKTKVNTDDKTEGGKKQILSPKDGKSKLNTDDMTEGAKKQILSPRDGKSKLNTDDKTEGAKKQILSPRDGKSKLNTDDKAEERKRKPSVSAPKSPRVGTKVNTDEKARNKTPEKSNPQDTIMNLKNLLSNPKVHVRQIIPEPEVVKTEEEEAKLREEKEKLKAKQKEEDNHSRLIYQSNMVKNLVNYSSDKNEIIMPTLCCALQSQPTNNLLDYVKLLLQSKANPNSFMFDNTQKSKFTALGMAVKSNNLEVSNELLLSRASVDTENCWKINETLRKGTALHIAARRGYGDVVELLLANQANVSAKDSKGSQANEITDNLNIRKLIEYEMKESK